VDDREADRLGVSAELAILLTACLLVVVGVLALYGLP
jgi:hypothetical protein